jgi:L-ornithine Nalpha-acyltransferase
MQHGLGTVVTQAGTPMIRSCSGKLRVELAHTPVEHAAVQALRGIRFSRSGQPRDDMDRFDPHCAHLMVSDGADGALLATARVRVLANAADFASCYTAQAYDLAALALAYPRALELGRLCLATQAGAQPDVLRLMLAGITHLGQQGGAAVLLGCASFHGADPVLHGPALGWLARHHLGPEALRPRLCAPQTYALSDWHAHAACDGRGVPALLRMYLGLGGWVSDHAVIDHDLDTVHILVAVPVDRIPAARLRALGALVASAQLSLA